jgi:hypothetical protein
MEVFPATDYREDTHGMERTPGPKIQTEVYVNPDTIVELYDYGIGCGVRIGDFFEGNAYIGLGWDEESRRSACDRLIAVLTAAREYVPTEPEPTESDAAEPEAIPA